MDKWQCACKVENKVGKKCGGCGWTYEKSEAYKKAAEIEKAKAENPPEIKLTAGGKKICMACAEEIQPAALVCPFCRLNPDIDPRETPAIQSVEKEKDISRSSIIKWAVIIFAVGSILRVCANDMTRPYKMLGSKPNPVRMVG